MEKSGIQLFEITGAYRIPSELTNIVNNRRGMSFLLHFLHYIYIYYFIIICYSPLYINFVTAVLFVQL